jgi:two-component system, cell cycle sensor histidine kinase and response regulator CckA
MSQATANETLTTLWNISTTLHLTILDQSLADADLTLRELRRVGFRCKPRIVGTRPEFLECLARSPCDIVLADYRLSGWTGMDAFAALRQSGQEVPFILVTGALGEEVAVECIKQGVTDYVLKTHLARLPIAVARALDEKSLRDANSFMVEALRESEANSLLLFEHNPLPMWVLASENLKILQVNDAAIGHYGYDRVEFLQMRFNDFHPAEEIPRLLAEFQQENPLARQSGQWHHRLKDGTVIDVEMILQKMEYSGNAAALVVAQDITARKRAEEERQKFLTLVENCRDIIAVADPHGNMEYLNPAGRLLLGIESADAVKGTKTSDYITPEDRHLMNKVILPAFQTSGHWQGELRLRHHQTGRALPVDFVGFLVKDPRTEEPRFIATVSRDISERRAMELQVQRAQKFEAVGQLAGGIAHDFNNVIGAILGWAELGEDHAASSGTPLLTYFKKIHTQCDRVTSLIRQLLVFARRQILEPRNLKLNQTVGDVLSLLDKVIGKDIEIHTSLAEDLPVVQADPTQIEQVLLNLCINSRDAMPQGGLLTIETRNAEFSEQECRTDLGFQLGRFAELRVTDTGVGMNAAVRERIFEPFFTTKGTGKGSGLGLATVFGIVKQHGGFVHVESEPGEGSTFRVFLPVSETPLKLEIVPPIMEDQPVRGGTETILIAEDHEGLREMAQATLRSLGYQVLLAADGEEAIATFTSHRQEISLVLLDVIMPRCSGLMVHSALKALKPAVAVIFVTGYSDETLALAEVVASGVPVLRKPCRPATLSRRVREVLDLAAASTAHHL